jgi:uncharacterized repeat protein (TIGR03803 family)
LTALAQFTGPNGSVPRAGLTFDAAGNLWGTTDLGGATATPGSPISGNGTVFKISPAGILSTVVSFTGTNGAAPRSTLHRDASGNLFGTTSADYVGPTLERYGSTVFKIGQDESFSTVASFTPIQGMAPRAGVVSDPDGNLYGTTSSYGDSLRGSVFRVSPAGQVDILANFNGNNGSTPYGGLVRDAAGNLYGTTREGGAQDAGTVFKITPEGAFQTIVHFDLNNGRWPEGDLYLHSNGDLYGTASSGGTGAGTLFRISPLGPITRLVTFTGANGASPRAGLVEDVAGNLFGTTRIGGANNVGTVFKLTPEGEFSTVYSFVGGTAGGGYQPLGTLVADGLGNLYGTTTAGGAGIVGTVFKLSDAGYISMIADTNGDNTVDFDDLLTLAQHYGSPTAMSWEQGDFTGDGAVNFDDLLILAQHYGSSSGLTAIETRELNDNGFAADWRLANSLVPEPACLSLLAICVNLSRRRRG